VGVRRKVLEPCTFSNGVTVPRGETLVVPTRALHMDNNLYENAEEFNGFRFSDMREREGESAKHHSVNTSPEFLAFGHAEHAWYFSSCDLLILVLEGFLL